MINAIRSEWIKLRTVTMNKVLGIIAIAFPLVVTLLTAAIEGDKADFDARRLLDPLLGTSAVTGLLHGVLAATGITGEYGFGTIRPTFAAIPRRLTVIAAKATVAVTVAAVCTALVQFVGITAGSAIASGQGATIRLSEVPDAGAAIAGTICFAALMAAMGLGVGMLIRSTPGAVTALLAWPLIVERLVGGLIGLVADNPGFSEWMPFAAGFRLLFIDQLESGGPSRVGGGLVFGAATAVVMALGAWLVNRRDA